MTNGGLFGIHRTPWAGLAAGPACWALDTQLNYALVPWACKYGWNGIPAIAALLAIMSLLGALSSWFAWRRYEAPGTFNSGQDGHPRNLLCGIGVAAGVLFAIVIAMQGIAGMMLDPCLR
jgi:hypothetical protein